MHEHDPRRESHVEDVCHGDGGALHAEQARELREQARGADLREEEEKRLYLEKSKVGGTALRNASCEGVHPGRAR